MGRNKYLIKIYSALYPQYAAALWLSYWSSLQLAVLLTDPRALVWML